MVEATLMWKDERGRTGLLLLKRGVVQIDAVLLDPLELLGCPAEVIQGAGKVGLSGWRGCHQALELTLPLVLAWSAQGLQSQKERRE